MIEKAQTNKPFILFAVAFGLIIVGLGTTIGIVVIHFLNNHLALFSQDNILLYYGWASVNSLHCIYPSSTQILFACQKLYFNKQYLMVQNILIILSVVFLLIVCMFSVPFIINLKKRNHVCMAQKKLKNVILGVFSFEMVFSITSSTFIISFYLDMGELKSLSIDVQNYQKTFFIAVFLAGVGSALLFAAYIIILNVKTAKRISKGNMLLTTEGQNPTYNNYTPEQIARQQESRRLIKQKNKKAKKIQQQMPITDFRQFYQNQKRNAKPPKPIIQIQEVQQHKQVVHENDQDDRVMYGGIVKSRPVLPTNQHATNYYPKRQRPKYLKAAKISLQALSLLNGLRYQSIKKKPQGQFQIVDSLIHQQNDDMLNQQKKQNQQNHEKEGEIDNNQQNPKDQISQNNIQVLNNKKSLQMQIQMVNMAKKKQIQKVQDTSHLSVFKRSMGVSKYLKSTEKQRNSQ